jgi:glucose-1-phosphate thymidylyltransferase
MVSSNEGPTSLFNSMKYSKQVTNHHGELIGLLPAGGKATRIAPLPCSKELFPVGFRPVDQGRSLRPKVVCHYLLEKMRLAGATKAYIILREGKWDIPAYLKNGKMLDMRLAYLIMDLPFGVPYTLDQAFPFVQHAMVVFGFPDIIFQPDDAYVQLLARQAESNAEIVLGLFPAHQPDKMDMVNLDPHRRVCGIQIKPTETDLKYTWYLRVNLSVSSFNTADKDSDRQRELFVGDVIQAAIDDGLKVDAVIFVNGSYWDIGTPEDLVNAAHSEITLARSPSNVQAEHIP